MKTCLKYLVLIVTLAAPLHATAQPFLVFGIELGKPLPQQIPACEHLGHGPEVYLNGPKVICHEPAIQLSDSPMQRGSIDFPKGQAPIIIVADGVSVYFWKGNAEAVEASTIGYAHSDLVVSELTTKFGTPFMSRMGRQVLDGVPVPSHHVIWHSHGLVIDYQSVSSSSIDTGDLLISSSVYEKVEADEAIKKESKRAPL